MLLRNDGTVYNAKDLPNGRAAREAVLATLKEVHVPSTNNDPMFKLGERARLTNVETV